MSRRASPYELHGEVGSAASILVSSSSGPRYGKVLCLDSRSALQPIIFNLVQSTMYREYVVLVRAARGFRAVRGFRAATPLLACCDTLF